MIEYQYWLLHCKEPIDKINALSRRFLNIDKTPEAKIIEFIFKFMTEMDPDKGVLQQETIILLLAEKLRGRFYTDLEACIKTI